MMALIVFLISALFITLAGTSIVGVSDRLADRTGLGEALMGGVFLGASTSISGSTLSMFSAYQGFTDLAISNALGGIALQTFFLCIADITYRKANLEHAAASSTNIMLGVLLLVLLSIPLLSLGTESTTYFGIHPSTPCLLLFYYLGLRYTSTEKKETMWIPRMTEKTIRDRPEEPQGGDKLLMTLSLKFIFLVTILIISGVAIEKVGVQLAESWGISHLVLGSIFTALATSLPELVTTLVAVRRGAVTLAFSGIIGGNTFDVLFLAFSDITYREGSLYHAMRPAHIALIALNILMTAVLLMGLIRREKFGLGNIGLESAAMAVIFVVGMFFIMT